MGLRALDPFNLPPEAKPKAKPPTLHIKDFRFSYDKHGPLIVDIPDLTLPQGEIIGIIGNNGAGKSTFARCLCGLDKRALGELELNGHSYRAKQRCHISYMVMQDVNHQLFTEDVLDELLLSMDGEDEKENTERANQILSSLDLADKIKLHPMSLSGGEKQRVAIGSAIASNKEILVFDEATSALDVSVQKTIVELLVKLQKEKDIAYGFICHDMALVQSLSHQVAVMYLGSIMEVLPGEKVASGCMHPYTKAMIDAVFDLRMDFDKPIKSIESEAPSPLDLPAGCPFQNRCPRCMEICRREKPALRQIEEDHQIACHLYGQQGEQR